MNRVRGHATRLLIVAALLGLGVPALATDTFVDVGADALHHDAARRLAESGVTRGCAGDPPRFCSGERLTRSQMALFLDRAVSRTVSDASTSDLVTIEGGELAGTAVTVALNAPGSPRGTSTAAVNGRVTVSASSGLEACPCEIEAFVYRLSDDDAQGPSSFAQLPATAADSSGRSSVSVPVSWGLDVPAATTQQFAIGVFLDTGSIGDATAEGTLTATASPYGEAQG